MAHLSLTSKIYPSYFPVLFKNSTAAKNVVCFRSAKKLAGGAKMSAQPIKKEPLPVETDVNKIVNFVCGANIQNDSEMIALKADSEYPDWLWKLNCGPPQDLSELNPADISYWRRLRKLALRRNLDLMRVKKF